MDVSGFFAKWLADVAADQKSDGAVPWVIPDVLGRGTPGQAASAGWSDVAVIAPWTMYQAYGDTAVLVRQYPSMRAWVEYERAQAGDSLLWKKGFHFGDWLAFQTTRADYPGATTDKDLIATAYFAHSTDLLARAAEVIGRAEDARNYRSLFERIRAAFQREYVTATGRLTSNTQTAYVLALDFDLMPGTLRAEGARRLAEDVRRMGHLTTGFLGTPGLTRMLSENGYLEDAYKLLLNERYPSWLYEVKQGATTVWERWDGLKPDSSFEEPSMNSFNHYAYGAVGDWMYRVVAGLNGDPAQPGYKHIIVRPRPGGGLTYATATLQTPYGEAASGWKIEGNRLRVTARVPANTRATVHLPGARLERVRENGSTLASTLGVSRSIQSGDTVVVEVGSGNYEFVYDAPARAASWSPALVDSLARFGSEDQRGRDALGQAVTANDTAVLFPTMRADSARSRWLRRVVRERGGPARGSMADSAAQAAWLILQHSPFNDWQEEMLPTLEQLAKVGKLPRPELAMFTDRVLVHRGKPQRYGSQFDFVGGRMVPAPIEDLPGLDARRAAIGLPPMAEYARMLGELYKLPVVWPPPQTVR
jgi:hypothetical protein